MGSVPKPPAGKTPLTPYAPTLASKTVKEFISVCEATWSVGIDCISCRTRVSYVLPISCSTVGVSVPTSAACPVVSPPSAGCAGKLSRLCQSGRQGMAPPRSFILHFLKIRNEDEHVFIYSSSRKWGIAALRQWRTLQIYSLQFSFLLILLMNFWLGV